jgi:hypothetical protein
MILYCKKTFMMIYAVLINIKEVFRKKISQKLKHFSEKNVYTNAHKNKL